ncbi:single-stranded DNA-binding protein [Streptomyces sp. NBC_00687]|uniref:single-stranded DNA-binding protein n=1 Tax=Streptomyces sp. NBC_00687 TaxID=2975807 RepID=UPI002252B6DE|nr:single-stranded DNA-binding protein [Streptomyces sp. NBC_00687]MCX4919845.1 single-stranded DNA-binding protein [Streptomyces sp. NBC_00687]
MSPPITHVSGTIASDVEIRFTDDGLAVCRFRLAEVPRRWDPTTQKWTDGTPIPYVCTAWGDIARNTTESLVNGSAVLVRGRITEIKDNAIRMSVDDLGLSLRQHIAYTDAGLPGPGAATPVAPPTAPQPAAQPSPEPAPRRPGNPPGWWDERRSSGWSEPSPSTTAAAPPLRVGS